jgi:hypothetical protein
MLMARVGCKPTQTITNLVLLYQAVFIVQCNKWMSIAVTSAKTDGAAKNRSESENKELRTKLSSSLIDISKKAKPVKAGDAKPRV